MSEKVDKQIEKLVEKAMIKSALESPSSNFTAMVMKHVYASNRSEVTVYKPLISKPMWFAIVVVTILLVSYIIFGLNTADTAWLNLIDLSILTDNKLSNSLSEFKVSKTVFYSVVMFSIMLFIQVPILKNYFNKRLAV